MKKSVMGSRQTMMNSLNRIAPSPRKNLCFIAVSRSSRANRGTSHTPFDHTKDIRVAFSPYVRSPDFVSDDARMLKKHRVRIRPLRVHSLDQCVLLFAAPSLDLLFPRDCVPRITETFVVEESINFVGLSKTFYFALLMLPDSSHQAVCNACIENHSAAIGHHVDIECFHQLAGPRFATLSSRAKRGIPHRSAIFSNYAGLSSLR